MTVGSITLSTVNVGKGFKRGRAVVVVQNDQGGLVANAVVGGYFSGTFNEVISASDPTDGSGSTTTDTTGTAKGSISLTFCVTSITHATLDDFTGEVCNSL